MEGPSPEVLAPGTALGLAPHRFDADRAGDYLTDVRDTLVRVADGDAVGEWR